MSKTESSAVVAPTTEGKPDMGQAAGVAKMAGGGIVLTPMPLAGGKRRSRKVSKKVLKMLKKMGPTKVAKMLKKGGQEEMVAAPETPETPEVTGARRARKGRKTARKSRRGFFY